MIDRQHGAKYPLLTRAAAKIGRLEIERITAAFTPVKKSETNQLNVKKRVNSKTTPYSQ